MIVNKAETVIVIGTYNRGHLLARSMKWYERNKNIALVVMDDGSTDNTRQLCEQSTLPIHYFYLGDKTGWRDSASFLNKGIRFALNELKARYIFITHPEIIPGRDTITESIMAARSSDVWVSCKGYYLTQEQQAAIDRVPWNKNILSVRLLPNFYGSGKSPEFNGNKDYLPESIDRIPVWQSWIFGGGSADMWRWFGGLTEFETWGSIDMDLLNRRGILGMTTVTPGNEQAIVVHQNHDDPATNVVTPRDMDKCVAALPSYKTREQALKPELLQPFIPA